MSCKWCMEQAANQQSPSPLSTQQHANCLLVQAEARRGAGDTGAATHSPVPTPRISTTTSKCLKAWSRVIYISATITTAASTSPMVIMSDDQKTEAAGTESSLITDHDESSAAEGK